VLINSVVVATCCKLCLLQQQCMIGYCSVWLDTAVYIQILQCMIRYCNVLLDTAVYD